MTRYQRQKVVSNWCVAAFGTNHASSVPQRAVRLLEEAVELYQAAGCTSEMAHKLIDHVFSHAPGDIFQELGGVGITTLAFAEAARVSAEEAEIAEWERVRDIPLEHFAKRNQVKNDAGFNIQSEGGAV